LSAVTENRKLVELFVRSLDTTFQNILNLKLSLLEEVKIKKFGKSRIEDSYDLEHIIQKAVELVSKKTII